MNTHQSYEQDEFAIAMELLTDFQCEDDHAIAMELSSQLNTGSLSELTYSTDETTNAHEFNSFSASICNSADDTFTSYEKDYEMALQLFEEMNSFSFPQTEPTPYRGSTYGFPSEPIWNSNEQSDAILMTVSEEMNSIEQPERFRSPTNEQEPRITRVKKSFPPRPQQSLYERTLKLDFGEKQIEQEKAAVGAVIERRTKYIRKTNAKEQRELEEDWNIIINGTDTEVITLLKEKPHLYSKDTKRGISVLALFCRRGNERLVEFLVGQPDIDVNESGYCETPLDIAIFHEHHIIVTLLKQNPSAFANDLCRDEKYRTKLQNVSIKSANAIDKTRTVFD